MTNTIPKADPANWRMVYNPNTKRVVALFSSTGITQTVNSTHVAATKQVCLDQAKALGLEVPASMA